MAHVVALTQGLRTIKYNVAMKGQVYRTKLFIRYVRLRVYVTPEVSLDYSITDLFCICQCTLCVFVRENGSKGFHSVMIVESWDKHDIWDV